VTARYDAAVQLWVRRGDSIDAAREQWSQHHNLPAPGELGIPAAPSH
jgi:hypothetical protein